MSLIDSVTLWLIVSSVFAFMITIAVMNDNYFGCLLAKAAIILQATASILLIIKAISIMLG